MPLYLQTIGFVPAMAGAIGFAIGNKGYILNGATRELWEYEPAIDEFIQKPSYPLTQLIGPAVFSIGTNVYICSGFQDGIGKTVYTYSQVTEEWTQLKDFPGPKRLETIGFSMNGKGYLTQGVDYDVNSSLNDFWEYDPSTDSWRELAAPNPSANLLSGIGFTFNNKAYIGLGIDEAGDPVENIWQYNPVEDEWEVLTTFPGILRRRGHAFVAGNNAYIINGDSAVNNRPFADFWRFKPETE